ncbi:sialidase family protein [Cecembia calidifontis]|jgi:predicted neuraminidase|uniref:Putative neuraminidase n=1 Tax=Cecembia calidifontis TaxID=1187080 RepID=A0A4V2F6D8_9BACT|nr:sialidase family protein [Cecembia calidifontis]RZS95969.1 putative neuraminidase [Cecembia calidifontis]
MAILRLSLLVFLLGTGLCHAQFMIFENIEPYVETIEFVFEENKPFAQCHASSIEKLGFGKYMIVWFAGSHEKNDDVGIWMSKGSPGNWSVPSLLIKVRNDPHWNPVLFLSPDNRLYLYFKVGKEIDDWETWVMFSEDLGVTWSDPEELVAGDKGGRGPVRNHILVLSNGAWLAPASIEKKRVWNAFVDRSDDRGESWLNSETLILDRKLITGEGVIQPALWESSPGNVHMLLRTSTGKIGRSDSKDYGRTWTPVELIDLPNNNSGIDVAQIQGETLALAFNPVGKNWGARYPMELAISQDNGLTWPIRKVIENGSEDNEFSYPSLIFEEGYLVLCYTWNRENIRFVKLRLNGN